MRSNNIFVWLLLLALLTGCQGNKDEKNLKAVPPELVMLTVTPTDFAVVKGNTAQIRASGVYSDYSVRDLTTAVEWGCLETAVATVGNTDGAKGVVTALKPGITTIRAALGGVTGWTTMTVTAGEGAAANVLPVSVDGVITTRGLYANRPTVSVTICSPGTNNCQTVGEIMLDTGSCGLRLFEQALEVPLQPIMNGPVALTECVQYADGTTHWGPVGMADVQLGGETAVQVPVQIIDAKFGTVPVACGTPAGEPASAGYNGILGVGLFTHDCGEACTKSIIPATYYGCEGTKCNGVTVSLANQVQNPVALLPVNNNGVLVQLPPLPSEGAVSLPGQLVLGIGTQPNNSPADVTVYPANRYGEFVTVLNNTTEFDSFIDSGSNALFFSAPAGMIPICTNFDAWYCPPESMKFSAMTTVGGLSGGTEVSFQVDNLFSLVTSGNRVFSGIAGSLPGGKFDWGLPFFFGRNVFVGFQGKKASALGTGPFWAY